MKWSPRLLAVVLLLASPLGMAATPGDACMVDAMASLDAMVRGNYIAAVKDFSPATSKALPPAKLDQVWHQVQKMFGAYHGHGEPHRQQFHGQSAVVARMTFAIAPLDFVAGCDTSNRITMFYLLKPSVVEAPLSIKANTAANGVRIEPLSVPSPLGPLRGALTLPAGKGPFPAVVLVQGSGAHDLDETIGPNKPFEDIAEGLAELGVASLRYDKRTFDHALETAAKPDFTVDDEVTDDALTALRLLAGQKSIDPHRVFVLGHSLGAQMAPRIAARDPKLAGVIMLAAPTRPLLTVMSEQAREVGPRQGMTGSQVAALVKANEAEQALIANADPDHPPEGSYAGAPQAYWLSLRDYDQVKVAKSLSVPMLILQGGWDFQVSPKNDFEAWKNALAGKPDVTFHLYPGLSHLFTPAGKTMTLQDYDVPAQVSPDVIHDIADWIKAQPPR